MHVGGVGAAHVGAGGARPVAVAAGGGGGFTTLAAVGGAGGGAAACLDADHTGLVAAAGRNKTAAAAASADGGCCTDLPMHETGGATPAEEMDNAPTAAGEAAAAAAEGADNPPAAASKAAAAVEKEDNSRAAASKEAAVEDEDNSPGAAAAAAAAASKAAAAAGKAAAASQKEDKPPAAMSKAGAVTPVAAADTVFKQPRPVGRVVACTGAARLAEADAQAAKHGVQTAGRAGTAETAAAAAAYAPPIPAATGDEAFSKKQQQQLIQGMFKVAGLVTVKCLDPARKGTQLELQVNSLVGNGAQAAAWLMEPQAAVPAAAAVTGAAPAVAGTAPAAVPGDTVSSSSCAAVVSTSTSSVAPPLPPVLTPATAPAKPLPEQLVLKVASPEAALAPSNRRKFAPGQWKLNSRISCMQEFDAMDAFAKSPWVLDCYGWGLVQLATGEEMPCLLLEYAPWGTLEEQLVGEGGEPQGLEPELCRMVVDYLVGALIPSKTRGVYVHRDIKPENIMLCNPPPGMKAGRYAPWVPKLGDWGISKQLTAHQWLATTVTGTPAYRAPEVRVGAFHDTQVDTWCIGCLLLHLRSGRLPFLYLWEELGMTEDEREKRRSGMWYSASQAAYVLPCILIRSIGGR